MSSFGRVVNRSMDRIDAFLILIAKITLAIMVLVTFASVIGRTFFNASLPDDLLIAEMMMVALVFLPLSWVQSIGAHLEVTVLTDLFPRWLQNTLVTMALVLGLLMFVAMTYLSGKAAYESYVFDELAYNSVFNLRDWPAKAVIPLGLGWWCLRIATYLVWPGMRPNEETEFEAAIRDTEELSDSNGQSTSRNTE
ncbi:TRAP transporter small permease [Alloalcanivorax xenomutans]|uniref:TRAP transporter small permease n=1 Tax=Alloalcanivorax xenomutans TaxID=1094342 RepID=UPI001F30A4DE|nr:TRAP transporter small permease [Alloalcanivorax xenomutans]MCE7522049.1 TRAP transporter small permease [Alloalcanivorax xenomutans]